MAPHVTVNCCCIFSLEEYARKVKDTGGVYFVPAFYGLLAPHWEPDARG